MDSIHAVTEAVRIAGSQSILADKIGARQQQVWNWLNGVAVPAWACAAIEHATDAKVSADRVGPALQWVRIADPEWPHPGGKPCIDALAAKSATPEPATEAGR